MPTPHSATLPAAAAAKPTPTPGTSTASTARTASADPAASTDSDIAASLFAQPWWPWLRRVLTLAFFLAVVWLVYEQAKTISWDRVGAALQDTPRRVIALAAMLSLATYGIYCTFDLIGRHYVRHQLSTWAVVCVGYISYAFNLNIGTLVGGVAFRYRLYSRHGLETGEITHIMAMSMLTNWIGYCLLAGVVFLCWPPDLPPSWKLGSEGLRWAGGVLLAVAALYVLLCAVRHGRDMVVRGRVVPLPSWPAALLQLGLSAAHWSFMAAIIFVLLQGQIAFTDVLATLMVAAMAGVLAHVPGGLGVVETVFVTLLGHQLSRDAILAAIFGYRAVYYLAPLVVATLGYFSLEWHARRQLPAPPESPRFQHTS